ncbi:hypothetical protein MRX96_000104 [Rhipicephalus microplus]
MKNMYLDVFHPQVDKKDSCFTCHFRPKQYEDSSDNRHHRCKPSPPFLMKMKHGLTFAALGALFSVHLTTVSRVFYAVLDLLRAKTEGWLVWFSREVVQETMPPVF